MESIYCSLAKRKWINRGFLTGPMCPIYGTGAVAFLICLSPIKESYAVPSALKPIFAVYRWDNRSRYRGIYHECVNGKTIPCALVGLFGSKI